MFEIYHVLLSSQNLYYDSKIRCDFVDLYYAVYGMRRPLCYTENFALLKPSLKRDVNQHYLKLILNSLIF